MTFETTYVGTSRVHEEDFLPIAMFTWEETITWVLSVYYGASLRSLPGFLKEGHKLEMMAGVDESFLND